MAEVSLSQKLQASGFPSQKLQVFELQVLMLDIYLCDVFHSIWHSVLSTYISG